MALFAPPVQKEIWIELRDGIRNFILIVFTCKRVGNKQFGPPDQPGTCPETFDVPLLGIGNKQNFISVRLVGHFVVATVRNCCLQAQGLVFIDIGVAVCEFVFVGIAELQFGFEQIGLTGKVQPVQVDAVVDPSQGMVEFIPPDIKIAVGQFKQRYRKNIPAFL